MIVLCPIELTIVTVEMASFGLWLFCDSVFCQYGRSWAGGYAEKISEDMQIHHYYLYALDFSVRVLLAMNAA